MRPQHTGREGTVWKSLPRMGGWRRLLIAWSALALTWIGCDSFDASEEPIYVVEAYLIAGEPLPQLRLSRTAEIGGTYDFESVAVQGAVVHIDLLDDSSAVAERFIYREATPGVYRPVENGLVLPLQRYALDVRIGPVDRLEAVTRVPGAFDVVAVNADTVVYQADEQFEVRVTESEYPGREQSFYLFTTISLDPKEEDLTPIARSLYEDQELTLEDLAIRGSPILNEANYERHPDGTISIRYPWLAVLFYGPTKMVVNALDDNLYDFVRTATVQQGGSTLPPGEIPNVRDHIEGGTGIFGSMARASATFFVARPD